MTKDRREAVFLSVLRRRDVRHVARVVIETATWSRETSPTPKQASSGWLKQCPPVTENFCGLSLPK
jgi:hypothetical protein